MKQYFKDPHLKKLVSTYFSNPEKRTRLKKGEIILRQNKNNNKLYFILSGSFSGYICNPDGSGFEMLKMTKGMFIGVYSFFSETYQSSAQVTALEDSEVAYIEKDGPLLKNERIYFYENFMPVLVAEVHQRQKHTEKIAMEKERANQKLLAHEKFTLLGKMSAGMAHELNNSISVLRTNTKWLKKYFLNLINSDNETKYSFFEKGLIKGRTLSSSETRKRSREILSKYSFSQETAKNLSRTGVSDTVLNSLKNDLKKVDEFITFWELGATLHDMSIASEQTAHVVKSMKELGAKHSEREPDININDTINSALSLLHNVLKKISVKTVLNPLPVLYANRGEFVQVWTNLLRNAYESMRNNNTDNSELSIKSEFKNSYIIISIKDNGPGIPPDILPKIFEPDITTKVTGLSFGLGLGLTIVQRVIDNYNGTISVKSLSENTEFIIKLPIG